MGKMQGDEQHRGSHLHLIVDSPLPKTGEMIPMDENHIHLMHGETKTVLKLAPGKHTLQLIVGGEDHVVRANAPRSKTITITGPISLAARRLVRPKGGARRPIVVER